MSATAPAADQQVCVACREPIRAGASICPHCRTPQSRSRWRAVGIALKWVGGAVTVISLVAGVVTLSGFYQDWRERRDAVDEIVEAADWLIRSDQYPQAWDMYQQAAELSPSAPAVRRGRIELAKLWLRDFTAPPERIGETLDALIAVLYRGIAAADAQEAASLLAHVAWAQILRLQSRLPARVDIDGLFDEALALDAGNVYANAFRGYWRLIPPGVEPQDIDTAQASFTVARGAGPERAHARRLQLDQLAALTYGWDDVTERAALAALLQTSAQMMQSGEPHPSESVRYKMLDAYGFMGRGEHVEALVGALPPEEHLRVLDWLSEDFDYGGLGRESMLSQQRYLRGRLLEAMGEEDAALRIYRALLLDEWARPRLARLVDLGIERVTGELPARALARSYRDDPVDAASPWGFHLETLNHFDPKWRPRNLEQALEFFHGRIEQGDPRLPELTASLPVGIARVRDVVVLGDEIARRNVFTSGYSRSNYDLARENLLELLLLQGEALLTVGEVDAAVAVLEDADAYAARLGEDYALLRARGAQRLAAAQATRASVSGRPNDRALALATLQRAIELGSIHYGITDWELIKTAPYSVLADEPAYQELVRGR